MSCTIPSIGVRSGAVGRGTALQAVVQLVEALRYKPRRSHVIFHWLNPSGHTMALKSTQPLTEMSTRDISWGVKATS